MYFTAMRLQWLHLTISSCPHLGHMNLVEPIVLVIRFLHELHTSCFSAISTEGIGILFKKVVVLEMKSANWEKKLQEWD